MKYYFESHYLNAQYISSQWSYLSARKVKDEHNTAALLIFKATD